MIEIIKFGAAWCGPCKAMQPTVDRLAERYNVEGSSVKVTEVDIDADSARAVEYGVQSIPTTVFLQDGLEVERRSGVLMEATIEKLLEKIQG